MNARTRENQRYYDQLYHHRSSLLFLLHGRLSFDQQSKTKPNMDMLGPVLNSVHKKGRATRILDYGSGWGTFLLRMPRKDTECYAFDIASHAIQGLSRAMARLGRTLHMPPTDSDGHIVSNDYDIILCSHVLEHVSADVDLLIRLVSSLRPGGCILLNVPINETCDDPKHAHRYSADTLVDTMLRAGADVLCSREADRWSASPLVQAVGGKGRRLLAKGIRALMALLPYSLIRWSESMFLHQLPYQQLLILGRRRTGIAPGPTEEPDTHS